VCLAFLLGLTAVTTVAETPIKAAAITDCVLGGNVNTYRGRICFSPAGVGTLQRVSMVCANYNLTIQEVIYGNWAGVNTWSWAVCPPYHHFTHITYQVI
jgi:hypothetical protein